jgi:hypothetical protein
MEALAEGATKEALTLATTFLCGRGAAGSSSVDKGIDSFIDCGLSEFIFVFFRGGASSSSPELFEENMDYHEAKVIGKYEKETQGKKKLTKVTSNLLLRRGILMISSVLEEPRPHEKAQEKDLH